MQTPLGPRDAITATLCTPRADMYCMKKLYEGADNGITPERLEELAVSAEKMGVTVDRIDLRNVVAGVPVPEAARQGPAPYHWPAASVLILRDAVGGFVGMPPGEASKRVYEELCGINFDTKMWMTRQNKAGNARARYTSVVADCERPSTMELDGRGVINHFKTTPVFDRFRHAVSRFLGRETPLISEINRYSDVKTAGIGW